MKPETKLKCGPPRPGQSHDDGKEDCRQQIEGFLTAGFPLVEIVADQDHGCEPSAGNIGVSEGAVDTVGIRVRDIGGTQKKREIQDMSTKKDAAFSRSPSSAE